MSRLRFRRSAARPAGSAQRAMPSSRANATIPALVGEPVSASTSSEYAIAVIWDPALDTSAADWSRTKSRFRRSGTVLTRRR